jgi:hypothetical protein
MHCTAYRLVVFRETEKAKPSEGLFGGYRLRLSRITERVEMPPAAILLLESEDL